MTDGDDVICILDIHYIYVTTCETFLTIIGWVENILLQLIWDNLFSKSKLIMIFLVKNNVISYNSFLFFLSR